MLAPRQSKRYVGNGRRCLAFSVGSPLLALAESGNAFPCSPEVIPVSRTHNSEGHSASAELVEESCLIAAFARETFQRFNHDAIKVACRDISQKLLESRPVQVAAIRGYVLVGPDACPPVPLSLGDKHAGRYPLDDMELGLGRIGTSVRTRVDGAANHRTSPDWCGQRDTR
jgi:hypothetical protein